MPHNDQAVRQLGILNKLEASRQGLTLNQLAEAIDPAATRHPRTLRRDLAAIEAVGWPLVTERVDGQVRWKLLERFRTILALRLSPSELMALTVSRRLGQRSRLASQLAAQTFTTWADADDPLSGGQSRTGRMGTELRQRHEGYTAGFITYSSQAGSQEDSGIAVTSDVTVIEYHEPSR